MKSTIDRQRRRLLHALAAVPLGGGVSLLSANARADCSDARSLVCVFLAGGADSFNLFVPGGRSYSDYATARGDLAVPETGLISVSDAAQGEFGFNALVPALATLYQEQRLAVVNNVGTLIRPTTPADYLAERFLPESLFAHNTQQKLWQTGASIVSGSDAFGWGGAVADRSAQCNGVLNVAPGFSISGSSYWLESANTNYITLNADVAVERMFGYDNISDFIPSQRLGRIGQTLETLIAQGQASGNSAIMTAISGAVGRATDATAALHSALLDNPLPQMQFDGRNKLATQLHLVARLIASRERLGMQRQVFYVVMGGWDTHSDQNDRLPILMTQFNEAIGAFQGTIDSLGLAPSVTSFTASDFGRTLTSNGNGTDHGWGGHNFVFGGAVGGGQVVGQQPSYSSTNNPDDAREDDGRFAGRLIPQLSVSQYAATLSRWMGVEEPAILRALPDLANFEQQDLGFMGSA